MKILRIFALILILAIVLMPTVPIFATADPDSPPTITPDSMHVYRNLLESTDMFYVWMANIPYAVTPATSMPNTFVWRLLDGATLLGSTTGFAYNDDGYNYNVFGMYFSAADVTSLGMVWGTAYTLKLSGNPAAFTTPPEYIFTIGAGDYTSLTDQVDNIEALSEIIISFAEDLNSFWSLTATYYLTMATSTGTRLSLEGETVFRGAMYGIQAMATEAFSEELSAISADDRSWNATYVTSLENQYQGSWIDAARNASIDFLGTGWDLTGMIIVGIMCLGLFIGNITLTNDPWNGVIDCAFILVIASRLAMVGLPLVILLAAIAFIYIATKIWRMIPGT